MCPLGNEMPLTLKQQLFVAEYLIDLNATQAAIRAGYSPKTAQEQSSRLLSKAMVAQAVAEGARIRCEKAELTAVRVLEEIRRIAFFDVRTLFDERGNLKPVTEWTAEQAACVASVEVIRRTRPRSDGRNREE